MSCSPAGFPRRRDRADQGGRRQAGLLRPGAGAGEEADALGRRRVGHRGHGGGRPHRPGLDLGPRAGDPAQRQQGHPGVRRRRDRPRRGDRRLPGDGRGRGPARHPLRLRQRKHRPRQLQESLHPRLGARRDPQRADRPAPSRHPRARVEESGDGEFRRQAARGRRRSSTMARSRWPRRSSRSSIIGRARSAGR